MPEYREKNEIESMQSSLGHQGYPVPRYASSLPVCQSATALQAGARHFSPLLDKLLPLSALILPPFPDLPPPLLTDRPSPCHFCLCY